MKRIRYLLIVLVLGLSACGRSGEGQSAQQGQEARQEQDEQQGEEAQPGQEAQQGEEAQPGQEAQQGQQAQQGQEAQQEQPGQQNPQAEVLVLAAFDQSPFLRKQVELYNASQNDYRIEIKQYERSEKPEEDGVLRLQRETVSGNGPDLIDFGNGYNTSDIVGKYTEDLSPYMGEEGRKACFENILTAFSYQEGLYAVPLGFQLNSFAGRTRNLEGRSSWTDRRIYRIFLDEAANYFGGAKGLEETADVIQARVSMYVAERVD